MQSQPVPLETTQITYTVEDRQDTITLRLRRIQIQMVYYGNEECTSFDNMGGLLFQSFANSQQCIYFIYI